MAWRTTEEVLGMREREARGACAALGWAFRDRTQPGWFTDDHRPDRINIRFGNDGTVAWAEIG